MAKSKTKRTDKEFDLMDKLKHENRKLKRELTAARKYIQRMGSNTSESGNLEKKEPEKPPVFDCRECGKGSMIEYKLDIIDGFYLYKKCNHCGTSTKMMRMSKKEE